MKQQADKEMKAIRRVLDIIEELEPSARARVMAFVHDRLVVNPKIETLVSRLQPGPGMPVLPFPDEENVKKDLTGSAGAKAQARGESFDLFANGKPVGGVNG